MVASSAVVFVSCDSQEADTTATIKRVTFEASYEGSDTRTVYDRGAVLWSEADEITVFSAGAQGQPFQVTALYEDGRKAGFTGITDVAAESWVAVYPHSMNNAYKDGVLSVSIPAEQSAFAGGFAPQTNVSVAYSTDQTLLFRNISVLIPFRFETDEDARNTRKVTFKVRKSETEFFNIAGQVDVTIGPDGVPSVLEGSIDNVVLNAPEDGFKADVTYYVPVCPVGECSGLQVSFTDRQEKTFDSECRMYYALERNTIVDPVHVSVPYDTLPDDFTITIDFTKGWPFTETCVAAANQVKYSKGTLGEPYTYVFGYKWPDTEEGEFMTADLIFAISKGLIETASYSYNADASLAFAGSDTANGGAVQLPGIGNRYLTKVVATKTGSGRLIMADPSTGAANAAMWGSTFTYDFYADMMVATSDSNATGATKPEFAAAAGKTYELRCRDENMKITKIVLTYSKTRPGNATKN